MYWTTCKQIMVILVTIVTMDAVWLTSTAPTSLSLFASIQGSPLQIRWVPALLTYVLMVAAIWYFAVRPAETVREAAINGALLGLSMYGLYDLTNYATLTRYTLSFALTDAIWGTLLFTVAAAAASLV